MARPYTSVHTCTPSTSILQHIHKILEISQIIKQNNEGREYIDVEIVKKMEDKISKLKAKPLPTGADAPGMSYTEILGNIVLGVFIFGVSVSRGNSKLLTDYLHPVPQPPRKIDDEEFQVFTEHFKND
ncbi:hypothetical protein LOD99_9930 [Oopsacas minuta]|uniref:Uncharacterized protein n=1 Tax=Oopsacas minuta TaxID=111878 RepID=A0AAV7KLK3_9METZ|nr:hypothetical protein LOD99_9930 [Oopsacas minuta]